MLLKKNQYLRDMHNACIGKNISHALGLLLNAWREYDYTLIVDTDGISQLEESDIEEFTDHLKAAGIDEFSITLNSITPEALHKFICWPQYYHVTAGEFSTKQKFYCIKIL